MHLLKKFVLSSKRQAAILLVNTTILSNNVANSCDRFKERLQVIILLLCAYYNLGCSKKEISRNCFTSLCILYITWAVVKKRLHVIILLLCECYNLGCSDIISICSISHFSGYWYWQISDHYLIKKYAREFNHFFLIVLIN